MKRKIDPEPFLKLAGALPEIDGGQEPSLRWIEIGSLLIDPAYQREIGRTGLKNIVRIAKEFEWARFSTVIVAPQGKDQFVIVDGQHRTTAAAMRGHKKVPCQIISVDQRKQAASFAAINSLITEMSPMQVHTAKVAAGDADALRLAKICAAGGVTICRYPVGAKHIKRGETMAVGQLVKALARYGEKPLRSALQCITGTRDGNPGMVRGQMVQALCTVLESHPDWMDHKRLIEVFDLFNFKACWVAAAQEAMMSHGRIVTLLSEKISAYLAATLAEKSPARAGEKTEAAAVPPIPKETPPAKPASKPARAGVLSIGRDTVSFRGQVRVSPRGVLLVAALAKAKPSFVGDAFLISRIWNARPLNSAELMDALVSDLACLKAIGLEVQTQRGLGRRLVEIDA